MPKPKPKPKPKPAARSVFLGTWARRYRRTGPNSIREQEARDKFDHLIAVDLEAAEAAVAGVVLP